MNYPFKFESGKRLLSSLISWVVVCIIFSIWHDKTKDEVIFRFFFTIGCWILLYFKSIIKLTKI